MIVWREKFVATGIHFLVTLTLAAVAAALIFVVWFPDPFETMIGGTELFLRQVPANTVEKVPVNGVASGSTVSFKAVTVDGSRTYQSRNAPLSPSFLWSVP